MKLVRMFLMIIALLSISASSPAPAPVQAAEPGVDAGFSVATTGLNGWYISDWTVYAVSPVLANGKLLQPGESLTISAEGEQSIEFVSPDYSAVHGQSTATQLARIDKTPPTVTWISSLNTVVTATSSDVSANIADRGSGICLIELSIDHGRSWIEGWNAAGFALGEPVLATTWTYHFGFPDLDKGAHVVILRAHDCAGNISPGELLVVRVK
jgi:hypothetical protein